MTQLGSLERAVMDVLWGASAAMSVHDIVDALADRDLAYTTVLTVVTNLHKKGFASRGRRRRRRHCDGCSMPAAIPRRS